MIPTQQELARQIAVMVELYPGKTTSEIAGELGYSPLFIINAINEAERMELLKNDRENDKLSLVAPVDYEENGGEVFGSENLRLQDEIIRAVSDANAQEQDIELETMKYWCAGIRPSAFEIALHVLKQLGFIVTYKLADPYDPKSVYEFLTLANHKDERWGSKQFKKPESKKQKKVKK